MPTINAASTPSRNVTTRAENMRSPLETRLDYENEFQFQFQLEIVSPQARPSNKLKMQGEADLFPRGRLSIFLYRWLRTWSTSLSPFPLENTGVSIVPLIRNGNSNL